MTSFVVQLLKVNVKLYYVFSVITRPVTWLKYNSMTALSFGFIFVKWVYDDDTPVTSTLRVISKRVSGVIFWVCMSVIVNLASV